MTNLNKGLIAVTTLTAVWFMSFGVNSTVKSMQIIPEWNGPDLKVTYACSSFVKMEELDMHVNNNNTVTVNYGALGRRRGLRNFTCLDK